MSFNSRPHTEVDRVYLSLETRIVFFQLTTSHGGRRNRYGLVTVFVTFQLTTSHGGRRTIMRAVRLLSVFQLTTSHGGRHTEHIRRQLVSGAFNSRPHTEVDFIKPPFRY